MRIEGSLLLTGLLLVVVCPSYPLAHPATRLHLENGLSHLYEQGGARAQIIRNVETLGSSQFVSRLMPTSGNAAVCAEGTHTRLQISRINVPSFVRHGQSVGQTKLVLSAEPSGEELLSKVYEGDWFCIGFNRNTKTYVVGGIFERGAWLPLASIKYLSEEGSSFEPSAFDRSGYVAMTAITSPGGRYIVFIGGQKITGTLHVLDTERDVVKELGPAPPPPTDRLARDICKGQPYMWGTCWGDGYVEMDTGIIRFKSEDVLEVSYGDDKPLARAKKRWIRRFKLG